MFDVLNENSHANFRNIDSLSSWESRPNERTLEGHNQPAWKAIEVLANPAEITRANVAMIKAFREALRASWSSSCSSR